MNPADLRNLIDETKKQLLHLQTLGLDGIQLAETSEIPSSRQPVGAPIQTKPVTAQPKHETVQPVVGLRKEVPKGSLFGELSRASEKITASTETFEQIHAEIGNCTRCSLHTGRTTVVHTEGNRKARLMFVGEAPGADEDIQARPFVGRAGQLLTKIIEAIGFKRDEVLIGNVNRCRPPGNRAPMPDEAAMCKPFLLREIAAVQPEVIVVLGNTAMRNLLDTREGITRLRGIFQDYKGIKVMPTFHPAYLLRDPSKKRETWEDLKKVRDYLDSTAKSK